MDNKRISEIIDDEVTKQEAKRYRDIREILKMPKSVADKLDEYYDMALNGEFENEVKKYFWVKDNKMTDWFIAPRERRVADIYLASKGLDLDIVNVVS